MRLSLLPFFTCESVITESCFLLKNLDGGEDAVLNLIDSNKLQIPFNLREEVTAIKQLMKQYKSVPMSLADACLVSKNERIIYHEAGHFLTAYLYQIPIIDYTLSSWEAIKKNFLGSAGVVFDNSFMPEKSQDLKEFNLMIERFDETKISNYTGNFSYSY